MNSRMESSLLNYDYDYDSDIYLCNNKSYS